MSAWKCCSNSGQEAPAPWDLSNEDLPEEALDDLLASMWAQSEVVIGIQ